MAVIDKILFLEDVKFWLPSSNTMTDTNLSKIFNLVIASVGDIDSKYEEALCKSLKAIALKNKADATANVGNLKKLKFVNMEEQYYSGNAEDGWSKYMKGLPDICKTFGYTAEVPSTQTYSGKIYIESGDAYSITDEFTEYTSDDLYL